MMGIAEAANADRKGLPSAKFPANSLRIPWWSLGSRCLCESRMNCFFYGKKFPAQFPAQGISPGWRRLI